MIVKTNLKPRDYDHRESVRIINPKQRDFYLLSGVMPMDIYSSIDDKTNKKILVYIFLKSDTQEVYQRWCNYDTEV